MTKEKQHPTESEIAVRAYELYLERGAEDGDALQDWLVAEEELRWAGESVRLKAKGVAASQLGGKTSLDG